MKPGHEVKPYHIDGPVISENPSSAEAKREDNHRSHDSLVFALLGPRNFSECKGLRACCGSPIVSPGISSCMNTAPPTPAVIVVNLHRQTDVSYDDVCHEQQMILWKLWSNKEGDALDKVLHLVRVLLPKTIVLSPTTDQCLIASEGSLSGDGPSSINAASHEPSRFTASGSISPYYILDAAPVSYTLTTPRSTSLLFKRPQSILEVATFTVAPSPPKDRSSYTASLPQRTQGSNNQSYGSPPPRPPIPPLPEPEDTIRTAWRSYPRQASKPTTRHALLDWSEARGPSGLAHVEPEGPPPRPPIQPLPEPEDSISILATSSSIGYASPHPTSSTRTYHKPKNRSSSALWILSVLSAALAPLH
jgi:hypothetical protein